ncbi:MAG: TIGR00730 family Rossman fold protein [Bacteroidetes bacterium]|nr:TIGR00730 family Rossman fold protein [Bacteroidota bacterium]
MIKSLCVFCGSSVGVDHRFKEAAIAMGEYLAKNKITLVYGGGRIGLMGLMAEAALKNGGSVVGVIPKFLSTSEIKHDGLTQCYEVDDMHTRKQMMYQLSDAFVAMPGGFGTLDELFEIITWHQLLLHEKPVAIYNVEGYFDPLLEMIHKMHTQKFIPSNFSTFIKNANTLEKVMELVS